MNLIEPDRGSDDALSTIAARAATRRVVGIGEFVVSDRPEHVIVTHALGSCIAVCLWDGVAMVGGLLHFLLPDAAINPERAATQPATFANTGLPLFFQAAYARVWRSSGAACAWSAAPTSAGSARAGRSTSASATCSRRATSSGRTVC